MSVLLFFFVLLESLVWRNKYSIVGFIRVFRLALGGVRSYFESVLGFGQETVLYLLGGGEVVFRIWFILVSLVVFTVCVVNYCFGLYGFSKGKGCEGVIMVLLFFYVLVYFQFGRKVKDLQIQRQCQLNKFQSLIFIKKSWWWQIFLIEGDFQFV